MMNRWMTPDEARRSGLLNYRNPRGEIDAMLIGCSARLGSYLWYRGDGHTMIFAPPGSGKGQGFIVPNCVSYSGSMVIIDPKGENAAMTALHRQDVLGQDVFVIDPFRLTGFKSSCFNPLDWLQTTDRYRFFEDCSLLADALVGPESPEHRHFREEAVNLMRALILYLFGHEPQHLHLNRLFDLAFGPDRTWRALFDLMADSEVADPDIRRIVRAAGNWYLGLEKKAKDLHRNTVQKSLQWLGGVAIPPVVERSDFDVKALKTRRMTIFVCIPGDERELYRPYIRTIVGLVLKAMYRVRGVDPIPVQFLCDEFYSTVNRMEIVDAAIGDMRGYGARFALVFQDFGQLKKLYPDNWSTFESSSGASIYIASDSETAEHVSKRLGDYDRERTPGGTFLAGEGGVVNRPPVYTREPLLSAAAIRTLGDLKEIVFVQHQPPLLCDRVTAYRDPTFQPFLRSNPTRRRAIEAGGGSIQRGSPAAPVRTVDEYLSQMERRTDDLEREIDDILGGDP